MQGERGGVVQIDNIRCLEPSDRPQNDGVLGSLGLSELLVVVLLAGVSLLPMAAAIWALVKLHQIGRDLRAVEARLDTIEQLLHKV
jgi:hypothetical protein